MAQGKTKTQVIKVAILAQEPLGWGSGKHYFPVILDNYTWKKGSITYKFKTTFIWDKDVIKGKLNIDNYDVLLTPGGGVGDGQAVIKGFNISIKVRKWKKQIRRFIENGGSYIGICGGAALFTDLDRGPDKKPKSLMERLYQKSSLKMSCVKHYYKDLALPIFYPSQYNHPERIGAVAYIFSFAPGITKDGEKIHTGGVPVDFKISKDNPIFKDYPEETLRIRWWGGPALTTPKNPDREVKVLAHYPETELSENPATKIFSWRYVGGITGLIVAFFKALYFGKKNNEGINNVLLYAFYLAKPWKRTNKILKLNFSNKPSITTEIYPNGNKARIILCTSHPEYMIWWAGHIAEKEEQKDSCIGSGFHEWTDIKPLSKTLQDELTYTWWVVRRMTAWAAKVPDDHMPPIEKGEINDKAQEIIKKNIYWDGTLIDIIKNI